MDQRPGYDDGPAVLAQGLVKQFGETKALDDVDLEVGRAKVVGLLGPNGAGKTTAVRVFTTLIKPDRGRAFIDGIDVLAQPMRAKARIGLTGQYAAVDERLTAFENLEHVGRLFHLSKATARERGRELLDRFDLSDAADRLVKGYSGGMRRRLDIAMSLIARPSVLFLDEPTTGLDPRSRQSVWELIEELVAGGTTTLLTTQYLDEAERLADEIVVIDHGRVIARGTSEELKQQVGAERLEITAGRGHCARGGVGGARPDGVRDRRARRRRGRTHRHRARAGDRGRRSRRRAPTRRRRCGVRRHHPPVVDARRRVLRPHRACRRGGRVDALRARGSDQPMTTTSDPTATASGQSDVTPAPAAEIPTGPIWVLKDSWTEATRHLRAVPRNPELLIFATIQPIMFVVLFVYVFGGSVDTPIDYKQYVVPGIFCQTVLFNSAFTGVGVADDLSKGIIDRLRSLPMYQGGVLIGRTLSDACRNVITFAVMFAVAYLVGFRIEGTIWQAFLATALMFFFSYAFSWIQAWIGLSVGSVEAANSAGFLWMFPLTFISSAFVDVNNMPEWLQPIARNNPFTILTNACRNLYNGVPAGSDGWIALAWAAGIAIVFAAIAIRKFAQSTSA